MTTGTVVWYLLLIAAGIIALLLGVTAPVGIILMVIGFALLIWSGKKMDQEDRGGK